jgi:hypothetical protein
MKETTDQILRRERSRELLQSLTEEQKDELVKLVMREINYTIEFENIDKHQVLSVKTVHELADKTVKRLNHKEYE